MWEPFACVKGAADIQVHSLNSTHVCCLTRREKGPFLSRRSVLFWYLRISIKALVPGRNLLFLGDAEGCSEKQKMLFVIICERHLGCLLWLEHNHEFYRSLPILRLMWYKMYLHSTVQGFLNWFLVNISFIRDGQ